MTPKFNRGAALRHIVGLEGIIKSIDGIDEAQSIEGVNEVTILKEIGDEVHYFKNGSDRIGYVIASANSTTEAIRICEEALSKIKITVG